MKPKIALVLSGGGARGAYQVGVLQGISEILKKNDIEPPFKIYTGVSAGAINASFLASTNEDFHQGVARLAELWGQLSSDQVFASDAVQMGKIAVTWARDLGFGALTGTAPGKALLETSPLHRLLKEYLNVGAIQRNIENGHLEALALTAVDYTTSDSVTFIQGKDGLPSWRKTRRHSEKTRIETEHVMASSAIPLLFPAIKVGDTWFGDGCVRNSQPCAPALYLGADRMIIVGVRPQIQVPQTPHIPSVGRVMNLLLNAVLLDGVELDADRMGRMNEFVRRVPTEMRSALNYREVNFSMISPSADIGKMAADRSSKLPRIVRYLLKGLGTLEDTSEIISYLLFDPEFLQTQMKLGKGDALRQEDDLLKVLR
ncbi:MAG: patatin-like phospholipase family protein [Bdellovibrionaceae bacterium]|nr:patatin-like phospholipase family protein [Pseudobdellovibrionaceae bacterium]